MSESGDSLFPDKTRLPGGEVVLGGRYRVIRELGQGAMGTVYLAQDTSLNDLQVAIKMPPPVLARNPRAVKTLKQEALLARKFTHPHVVTLRSFESMDEGVFIVMDYVEGQTLEDVLTKNGPVSEDFVREVFGPIADALDHAHGEGVIHRDVKPSNVMIRKDGRPMLADFGIARQMKDTMTRMTGLSSSGTLPYMSPEQLRGHAPAPEQDVYSLAATMYECLAGQPPFHRGEIAYQIATVDPPPLTSTPTPLTEAIMQGLSKDPGARPKSCRELLRVRKQRRGGAARSSAVAVWTTLLLIGAGVALAVWQPWKKRGASPTEAALAGTGTAAPIEVALDAPVAESHQATRRILVRGRVTGDVERLRVNGNEVAVESGAFSQHVTAPEDGLFLIRVQDQDGTALTERAVLVDSAAPVIEILEPKTARVTLKDERLEVVGRVREDHLERVTVNGRRISCDPNGAFRWPVALTQGEQRALTFEAADRAGNKARSVTLALHREPPAVVPEPDPKPTPPPPPAVELLALEPADGAWIREQNVVVSGRVSGTPKTVQINGMPILVKRGAFRTTLGTRRDGPFEIRILDEDDRLLERRNVRLDRTDPVITVAKPAKRRHTTQATTVQIEGRVQDANLSHLRVNGKTISTDRKGAFAWSVRGKPGEDRPLRFEAVDKAGNRADPVDLVITFAKRVDPHAASLAKAVTLGKLEHWGEAREHLSTVPSARVPAWLRDGIQDWERKPSLSVKSPRNGARLERTHFHVEGTLATKRKTDELFVNDEPVEVSQGKWLIGLDGEAGKTMRVRIEVRDGKEVRLRKSLTVSFHKRSVPTPSWARGLLKQAQLDEAQKLGIAPAFENSLGMRFVLIPRGTFSMGSPASDAMRRSDEARHAVTLTRPFYMQITEVTNAQYRRKDAQHSSGAYVHGRARGSLNGPSQPVVNVSWNDAVRFANWLSRTDKKRGYRLPREAEWEYACRANTTTRFYWGHDDHGGYRYANANDPLSHKSLGIHRGSWAHDDGHRVTGSVLSYSPNPWGLYCMAGNAGEWCSDWYGPLSTRSVTDPTGPAQLAAPSMHRQGASAGARHRDHRHGSTGPAGPTKVIRGGAYNSDPKVSLRAAARMWSHPDRKWPSTGFRLVVPIPIR